MPSLPNDIGAWRDHFQDEADAAFLYRALADVETDPQRRDIFNKLAQVEDRHTGMWSQVLSEHEHVGEKPQPTFRARLLAWIAGRWGPGLLLPILLREEGHEVRAYLELHRDSAPGSAKDAARTLATESAKHAETLGTMVGVSDTEPWHKFKSGGYLGNVIYGFNDGLTANFGLVAGVIGASVGTPILLVTGLAGVIADALSMGSSSYLAAKSEQEVYVNEIEMEKAEIELMPELEEKELALMYELKGIDREQAKEMARSLMSNPQRALEEQVREELRIGTAHVTPIKEGWLTGLATALGAMIPVAPFLFLEGRLAVWCAFVVAMLSHFAVGAARSIFTGRSLIRSGMEMFAVGMGIAIVGFVVGDMVIGWF